MNRHSFIATVALCATGLGLLSLLNSKGVELAASDIVPVAVAIVAIWLALGLVFIAIGRIDYVKITLLAQVMSVGLLAWIESPSDPNWHTIVGVSCVFLIVGAITGTGYVLLTARRKARATAFEDSRPVSPSN